MNIKLCRIINRRSKDLLEKARLSLFTTQKVLQFRRLRNKTIVRNNDIFVIKML